MPFNPFTHKYIFLWLAGIVLLGLALRLHRLDTHGIFLDEKYTMVISQGVVMDGANQKDVFTKPTFTPRDFWKPKTYTDFFEAITRGDIGNSPAYYAVLHGWMRVFGLSDFSARLLSVLFSTSLIGLLFFFVRYLFRDAQLALLSAFLAAVEPFFIVYSQQARNYSMSFFLTLLATYCFARIIAAENRREFQLRWYVVYALTAAFCLLSHFLTFTVFIGHGLYALLFFRVWRGWLGLGLCMAFAAAGMALWMTYGGGQWTLRTLAYQANLYREMAQTRPTTNPYGVILPATPANVFQKSVPMFGDLFFYTSGLAHTLLGKRSTLLALIVGLLLVVTYQLALRKEVVARYGWVVVAGLLVLSSLFYSLTPASFVLLSVAVLLFYLLSRVFVRTPASERHWLWFLVIMALTPNLFLVVWAFRNNHTYGLTQRYGGFSFPYAITLSALGIRELFRSRLNLRWVVAAVLLVQVGIMAQAIRLIYADRHPRYQLYADERQPNPHYAAAQQIKRLYEPGDTVKYPTQRMVFETEVDRTFLNYSLKDAQLTNLYLPKDAGYVQQIDTTEFRRIVLVKGRTGQRLVLADLQIRY